MNNIWNRISRENQPRIAVPTYAAFGAPACARVDSPVRKHTAALVTGATPGTSVWSPPPG